MDLFFLAIGSIAVGLVVGVLSGLLGIGGGTILVPTFKLGYLMDSIACTATSLFTIIPTSVSGAISHLRNKTCVPALGVAAGLGGAVTSPLGVWLASRSEGWMIMLAAAVIIAYSAYTMLRKAFKLPAPEKGAFRANVRAARASRSEGWMIMLAAAVIIAYSAYTMLRKAFKLPAPEKGAFRANVRAARARRAERRAAASSPAGSACAPASGESASEPEAQRPVSMSAKQLACGALIGLVAGLAAASSPAGSACAPASGESASEPEAQRPVSMSAKQLACGALIGLVAGLASGYVGVGGGFLMVPLMLQFIHTPMRLTSGTSLIAVMILAVPGVVYQAFLGNVNWVVGIAVAVGSIPGAALGAKLVSWVPERTLRFIFGGLLFVAAVLLVVNQTGLLG